MKTELHWTLTPELPEKPGEYLTLWNDGYLELAHYLGNGEGKDGLWPSCWADSRLVAWAEVETPEVNKR